MKLHTLKPAEGSVKTRKRIGRGTGSGLGGTSTRGHKGAKSRSGYSKKFGFEGGQMPLQRRIPKFGFNNPNKIYYKAINLYTLQELHEQHNVASFGLEEFKKYGLMSKNDRIKILGNGEVKTSFEVKAHRFSESAKLAIENAGGTVHLV
jgi:large subunit ribosomal protein L15